MTRPEEASDVARERAAAARARGGYALDVRPRDEERFDVLGELLEAAERVPDLSEARSTRALGAPVTLFKQALVRALGQYTHELLAQRRAFHAALAREIAALDERVERLR